MTVLFVCALVAAAALGWHLAGLAGALQTARWPERDAEHVEDDRSHDHRLAELSRQLGRTNLSEAHRSVVALAERLVADGQVLDAEVSAFLAHPPLGKPHRYRRELDIALSRLEQT
ncbi:MAG: hypothetical protein ACR2FE_03675 [Aeromicrobium sp.]